MKIAAYIHYFPPKHFAGSELYMVELLKALQAVGHEVLVICTMESGDWEFEGIRCTAPRPGKTAQGPLNQFKPDVVITHHQPTNEAVPFSRKLNAKVVQVVHNDRPYMNRLLDLGADLVIYNTHHVAKHFEQYKLPFTVLHPPTDVKHHSTTPGDKVTLINLSVPKGVQQFYELADRLPKVQFLGVEGGHSAQIFERRPNIEFQRQTTNMRDDVWARTRILLVPSSYESWGMVAAEAIASGIPVIASPTPGLKECLGDSGVFVDHKDLDGWELAVRRLLDEDRWDVQSKLVSDRSAELDANTELEDTVSAIEGLMQR